ncbi:MAG: type II CAAX endopeptidase family protein [Methanobacterium sp.]
MENIINRGQLKKELYAFLTITFIATYLLQFYIYHIAGYIPSPPSPVWSTTLAVSMFIPATSAIICMIYFKSRALTREVKVVFAFFILYAVLFAFENYSGPVMGTVMNLPVLSTIIAVLGMLVVILLNLKKKTRKGLSASKLSFGKNRKYYLILPLIILSILICESLILYLTGSGSPMADFNIYEFLITLSSYFVLYFFAAWTLYFGEELGWRVYLQDRLFPLLGGYKGVLVLGIIWGIWHYPMNAMGYNFPGQPILGNALMTVFTIIFGIILSYAVLKTGSVWIAVIMHLINNKLASVVAIYIAYSTDALLVNTLSCVFLGIFALVLLRSKLWGRVGKVPESP